MIYWDDILAGILVLLTTIHGRDDNFFAKGDIDSELSGRESQVAINLKNSFERKETMRRLFFLKASILFLATCLFSQSIKIINPSGGQKWRRGGSYVITWNDSGFNNPRNIKILLLRDNVRLLDIAANAPNNGNYSWTIPGNLATGTFRIRRQTVGDVVLADSDPFAISAPPSPLVTEELCHRGLIQVGDTISPYTLKLISISLSESLYSAQFQILKCNSVLIGNLIVSEGGSQQIPGYWTPVLKRIINDANVEVALENPGIVSSKYIRLGEIFEIYKVKLISVLAFRSGYVRDGQFQVFDVSDNIIATYRICEGDCHQVVGTNF